MSQPNDDELRGTVKPYRIQIFTCHDERPDGCASHGAEAGIGALMQRVAERGLRDTIKVTPCSHLGGCRFGPNLVVYPAGTWYGKFHPEDVDELLDAVLAGRIVERLYRGGLADTPDTARVAQ